MRTPDSNQEPLSHIPNRQERSNGRRDYLPQAVFLFALAVIVGVGVTAYRTVRELTMTQGWVTHSLQVESVLSSLRSDVIDAQGLRRGYVIERNDHELQAYYQAINAISQNLMQVRKLTADNPDQQNRLHLIQPLLDERLALQHESIELVKSGRPNLSRQAAITARTGELTAQVSGLIVAMEHDESALLTQRQQSSAQVYTRVLTVLAIAFGAACLLLFVQFWMLTAELKRRKRAETIARVSEQAARRLSARLLNLQDEERRRFSRELHDSLGQYLSALSINLSLLESSGADREQILAECRQLLDNSLTETRTLSHLLHPPLLDEAGLASAVRWYVEGFAARSGIKVELDIPDREERLPQAAELVLFRVLQESLTNIHRHSKSATAEVTFRWSRQQARLMVRDFGKGIPPDLLESFRSAGTGMGVGLGGMRERLREAGGQLEIHSDTGGTVIHGSAAFVSNARF